MVRANLPHDCEQDLSESALFDRPIRRAPGAPPCLTASNSCVVMAGRLDPAHFTDTRGVESAGITNEQKRNDELLRRSKAGLSVSDLAAQFGMSRTAIHTALVEARKRRVCTVHFEYIDNPEFHVRNAEGTICGEAPVVETEDWMSAGPRDLPAYLSEMYTVPLLSREQEQYYFRRFNFRKMQFQKLHSSVDFCAPAAKDLSRLDCWLDEILSLRNLLIRSNLRLVVSIARKYLRSGIAFFDLVSDGNISLMRAVEKFDFSRGNKFSTYATWAVLKNFARSIPAEHQRLDRFRTGQEDVFQSSTESRGALLSDERLNAAQRAVIRNLLSELDGREQTVLSCRFGLVEGTEPETLEQVGSKLGVTKERVRQIEVKSLEKLRRIAERKSFEIPGF